MRGVAALVLLIAACADVRRGEYWDEPGEETGGADGAADGDSGPGPADDGGDAPADDGGSDGGADDGGSSGGAASLSFAADIFEILDAGCERCHSPGGDANDTSFVLTADVGAAYEETLPLVDLGTPAGSRLLAKGAGQGHTGGVIYDDRSTEYATILAWIEQGAMP